VRTLLVLLLLVGLGACKKERVLVSIDGVSATVPADFVPMDPERVEALRDAALAADPSVEVAMVGRKPPQAPMPWMYLQRTAVRPTLSKPLQASKVLDGTISELKQALTESGLETVSATSSVIGESHELCFVTKASKNQAVLNHTCLRMWVGAQSKRVHTISVVCLSTVEEPQECQRVLDSKVVTVTGALPLSQPLEPW